MHTIRRVFYRGRPLQADAEHFNPLGGPYARDTTQVYFRGRPLAGADAASFRCLAAGGFWNGAYACDDHHVFHDDELIEGADPSTFIVLDSAAQLARDAVHVYHRTSPLQGQPSDTAGFRLLGGPYATDGNLVFLCREQSLTVLSSAPSEFRVLDTHYAIMGNELLFEGSRVEGFEAARVRQLAPGLVTDGAHVYSGLKRLEGVDAATFRVHAVSADPASPCFAQDARHVFRISRHALHVLENARPDDFIALDTHYGHDGERVFYYSQPLEGADPCTFQSLGHGFAKDARQVFHEGHPIDGHAPSFRHLVHHEGVDFLVDREHVYRQYPYFSDYCDGSRCEVLPNADPASITVLSASFSRDANTVFQDNRPLAGARAETFVSLGHDAFTDGLRLWFHQEELHDVVVPTFQPLGNGFAEAETRPAGALRCLGHGYAADDLRVYFRGTVIANADAKSFQSLGHEFARDANHAYAYWLATESKKVPSYEVTGGELDNADPASLQVLGRFHATDGRRVYWRNTEVKGLNSANVRVLGDFHATDGDRLFYATQPIPEADVATFEPLPGHYPDHSADPRFLFPRGGYGKDRHQLFLFHAPLSRPPVYVCPQQQERLNGISAARFHALDAHFGSDGVHVLDFSRCRVLDADAASFRPLGQGFGCDAQHVFHGGYPLRDAEVSTFKLLSDGYGLDSRRVFHRGHELVGVDPSSFRTLGHDYATDGASIFRCGHRQADTDVATFEVFPGHGFARDSSHDWPLAGDCGDAGFGAGEQVELLKHGYWLKNGIPHWGSQALRTHRATFEVLEDGYAQDAHNGFYNGLLLSAVSAPGAAD